MITGFSEAVQSTAWQDSLKTAFKDPKHLLDYLGIPFDPSTNTLKHPFPIRVTRSFADRMLFGDASDPLLRQVLINREEWHTQPGFSKDPLVEHKTPGVKGLLHKYRSRVLLLATSSCAIHCRYCFRKHFPYETHRLNHQDWENILSYISQHPDINEVIFSGGDPLIVTDTILQQKIALLEHLPQLRYLRFHTRLPIVLPNRITSQLIQNLQQTRFNVVMVIHCNHPNELNQAVQIPLLALKKAGITLLNQSVLLNSINDSVACLSKLSYSLFDCGVLPYYLHQLDKVSGTHHFEVPMTKGHQLMEDLRNCLPGYLVPQWVVEVPFRGSKQPI